jgi:AcrR family transcriptional regulator
MGTTERKQREFELREKMFLDKAEELIRTDGLMNLQMARLADACDYATGTLYQHFTSKEDLLVALACASSAGHVAVFQRLGHWQAVTRDRMFAVVVCDADYAHNNPVHTRLMQYVFTQAVWENASEQRRAVTLAHCDPISEVVSTIVREAIKCGDLPASGRPEMELALGPWCLSEGMHHLISTQGLLEACGIKNPRQLLFQQVHTYLNGMNWQPLMDLADSEAIEKLVDRIRAEVIEQ